MDNIDVTAGHVQIFTPFILSVNLVSSSQMHPYKRHYVRMASYDRWAFQQLFGKLDASISDEHYHANSDLFFRSIHGTLVHLLLSSRLWNARLTLPSSNPLLEKEYPFDVNSYWSRPAHQWEAAVADRKEVYKRILAECDRWIDYVDQLDPEALMQEESFSYLDTDGNRVDRNRSVALDHIFNHNTHHRGQITSVMTRYGGCDATPILDISLMPAELSS